MKTRKIIVVSILVLLIGTCFVPFVSGDNNSGQMIITVNESDEIIEITYEINDFEEEFVDIDDTEYSIIKIGEESNLLETGNPDIPNICRSIVIPDTAKMKVDVVSTEYVDYNNVIIAPSKGNLLRTVNPDDIPYEFGEVYNVDDWFPGKIAELRDPYIIRDFRGQVVEIYPIQYNPVTKIMRFYNEITVEVIQDGEGTINCIYREELPEKVDFDFKLIYEQHFINYGQQGRYDPVIDIGNMLVIVYDSFWDEMVPFVDWKNMKGIPTEMVKVSEIGNANAIKTYIEDYYNSDGLTFVLLVGDAAQVPTFYAGYVASDPSYSFIIGNDHYSDLFVGRFSAENTGQLQTQVERTLEYEQNPQAGEDWYKKGLGVASNQGSGDDGEYDDEHMDVIRDKLLAYTYIEVEQSYDPWGTSTIIANALNAGTSTVNYCGHGSPTSWGNGGGFSNSDVNSLVNDNMLPFITSVACNNGEFDSYTCFAEAWMRATNNGEPTGSIANFMSTISQSWSPPMDAQDEF
ncbi:MAG: peptidase C25, partial [Thermoplasmatales archaeon]|nr:peptidase C25 [Thermoplasmatales archaeon]